MRLTVNIKDNKQHIDLWLSLWQGGTKITTREKAVLAEFIVIYMLLKSKKVEEPYLSKLLFDSDARKEVCNALNISSFNLTNIIAALKAKECILDDKISPQLIPDKEFVIEFK